MTPIALPSGQVLKRNRPGVKRPSDLAPKSSRLGKLDLELHTKELRVANSHRVVVSLAFR